MIRVMLVDDEDGYRRLLRRILEREADFQVVAEAEDGSEALELINDVAPDLVIMDVQMPAMSGTDVTRLILQRRPETKVVLISRTSRGRDYSLLAKEAGAIAFASKETLGVNLLREVLQV